MCAIEGLILGNPDLLASYEIHEGLYSLQHRGQDAAGIVTCGDRGRMHQIKGNGMVADVFRKNELHKLPGSMGIGHLRYPTAGSSAKSEAQPFYVNSPYGIVLAHNGNLVNAPELKVYLDEIAHRHVNTDSDSELILNIFASELQSSDKSRVNTEDIFNALKGVFKHCEGGYACTAMLAGFGIIGFRDSYGIRPLIFGKRVNADNSIDYMFTSESVVCSQNGFKEFRDVLPGEAIIVRKSRQDDGHISKYQPIVEIRQIQKARDYAPDLFEYVYFARPDSVLDGISVYQARLNMGQKLAYTIIRELGPNYKSMIDVVIPVPDSARTSALQCSQALGVTYREGFIKNRYIGRTFIMPGAHIRKKSVRRKLSVQPQEFFEKNVLIIDDSIVRGTTSYEISLMAKEAGAKRVYFASCAPAIRHPHIYGIDLADRKDLVAFEKDNIGIAKAIGAEKVIYQTLEDLYESCQTINPNIKKFEDGVFTGCYVTGSQEHYLKYLEKFRAKNKALSAQTNCSNGDVGLHNDI